MWVAACRSVTIPLSNARRRAPPQPRNLWDNSEHHNESIDHRGFPVSGLHVLRRVGEGGAVLGGGVLRPVRRHVAQDHHDGAVGVHPLRRAEVVDAFVGDDVGEVVLWREQLSSCRRV